MPADRIPNVTVGVTNAAPLPPLQPKPDTFASYAERLDYLHAHMEPSLRGMVIRADQLFRDGDGQPEPADSRFRLSFEFDGWADRDDRSIQFRPNLDADIELPNLEHRWKVYVRSHAFDSITDRDSAEEERTTRFGLSGLRRDLHLEADAGIRLRVQPEAYTRLQWRRAWTLRYTVIRPAQRLFYETDKGFGESTSLTVHRWLGRRPRVFVQSVSQAELSESSDGLEFEQSVRLGRLTEALEPVEHFSRLLGDRDIARGHVIKAGVWGHHEGGTVIDGYRLGYLYRRPLYKKWIYLSVNPEVLWEDERNWEPGFRLRLGADMLFWGTMER